jgi:xanthine dehydrogenase accessory factor
MNPRDIFQASLDDLEQGKSTALVTIIQANARWRIGARMLVRADGTALGDLGNAQLAASVREIARQALADGTSRHISFSERDGALVQTRDAGDVAVFIQVLLASPTLLLIGAGHIGEQMVRLAKMLKWRVVVVDDRPDFLSPARLPDADERILISYDPSSEVLAPMPITITPSTFVLLATWGWDQPALKQVIHAPAAYIGLVASPRKSIIIFRDLIKEGISPDALARVRVPTGLDLGAETPAEIALSIMAEMLMVHRRATGMPLAQLKGSAIMRQSQK